MYSCLVDLLCKTSRTWTANWYGTLAAEFVCTLYSSGNLFCSTPCFLLHVASGVCGLRLCMTEEKSVCGENMPKYTSTLTTLLLTWVAKKEKCAKSRDYRSLAWTSQNYEVFSDDRYSQDSNLLLKGPIWKIYIIISWRDLYSRSPVRAHLASEVLAYGILHLVKGCFAPSSFFVC